MTEIKHAELDRCYYRSVGQTLTIDTMVVEFEVEGSKYTYNLPNGGWSLRTPALQFLGYIGKKPSDFDGCSTDIDVDFKLPVFWDENQGLYAIHKMVLQQGVQELKKADWFNPEGDVWNSGNNMATGGMSVDPSTGNRAGVPATGEEE